MKIKNIVIAIGIFLLYFTSNIFADTTFSNTKIGYKGYLPDNWVREPKDSVQDYFYDTTGAYGAWLSIVRYPIDAGVYDKQGDWTRAHFIAYKMYMDYYPFGTVLFYDTAATEKQGNLWATELYLRFFTDDTANYSWDEYNRYTDNGKYGYELYAIGDTVDVKTNVGFYGAILKIIEILDISAIIFQIATPQKPYIHHSMDIFTGTVNLYDVLGRKISPACIDKKVLPAGVYLIKNNKVVNINGHK